MNTQQPTHQRWALKPLAGVIGLGLLCSVPAVTAQERSRVALEEVVVTAEKREASLTDVAVAVTAFSGETLDLAKVSEFQDLVQVSPSLTFTQAGDQRGSGILVRGIGTTSFGTAVEPTVSTVVDGVTMGRTVQFISDLADIERVEVLRGPQGTLFGKNASAGLIHIVTKRPSDEFTGSVRGSVTDDDAWAVNASVSGPFTDSMRGRLSAYTKEYDGFGKNEFTGNTINGDESWGVRGKLDIDLSDTVNLYLIADYSKQDRNCCSTFQEDLNNNRFWEYDYAAYGITVDEENNKTTDFQDGFSDTETSGVSAELTVDFEHFTLTSITAYRGFELETAQGGGLPYDEPTYGRFLLFSNGAYDSGEQKGGNQEQTQFSQELRIASNGWETLDLTAGLFYWNQSVDRYFERHSSLCIAPDAADTTLSPDPGLTPCTADLEGIGYFDSSADTENWAVFGQADWHLTDALTATLGLRYVEDDIEVEFERVTASPGPAVPPSQPLVKNQTDESAVTGKIGLSYNFNDDLMAFASYSTGYKAPAFDMIFGGSAERIAEPVPKETSDAYEAGIKGEFFDNRLRMSLVAFHTTFHDLQGQGSEPGQIGFNLVSAGDAVTKGLEFEATAMPIANLLLNGGISYTDATYDEFTGSQCYPGQTEAQGCIDATQDLSGEQIVNAPEIKYSVQARYDFDLGGSMVPFISGTYRWQSDTPGTLNHDPRTEKDSYGILDLVLGVEDAGGRWSAQVFAKNALDDSYVDTKDNNPLTGGIIHYLSRDYERYVGVELEYRFGAL